MFVQLKSKGGDTLALHGATIAVQASDDQDIGLIAELEKGASPVHIVLSNGRQHSVPVRQLTVVSKRRYFVKDFRRHTKDGIQVIKGHYRRHPVRRAS